MTQNYGCNIEENKDNQSRVALLYQQNSKQQQRYFYINEKNILFYNFQSTVKFLVYITCVYISRRNIIHLNTIMVEKQNDKYLYAQGENLQT